MNMLVSNTDTHVYLSHTESEEIYYGKNKNVHC
jgi:hypothetical protein